MKINFKRTAALALAGILAVSCFAGCGKGSDKDEQGRTILEVGGYPTKEGVAMDNFDAKIETFMKDNPDVNVKGDTYGFSVDTFFSKAAGGQLPNIFTTAYTEVQTCVGSAYVKDITEIGKKYGYDETTINKRLLDGNVLSKDGVLYGIPSGTYALGLAFNGNLFEQAGLVDENGNYMIPKTWDEVAQFSVQIKEKTGKAGFFTGSINRIGGWLFTPVAWSYGVEFMKKDKDGKWKATFDSPEMVEALQFYYDLKWKYDVVPADIALVDNTMAPQKLAAGEAAMLLRAPDYFDQLNNMGVDIKDFGLMPIPAGPKRHVTLLGGSAYMISEKSTEDQVDAAMRWIAITTNHKLTDTIKANKIKDYETRLAENKGVGVLELSNWDEDTEIVKWERDYELEHANLDLKKVEAYNEFTTGKGYKNIEIQPEEPMCAQELYAIVDKLVQEVFTNKNVDIAKIVKEANKDFQQNYLDYV